MIIGSAPVSKNLENVDLSNYNLIAINKSWRLRNDFDTHVFLRSLKPVDRPPKTPGLVTIGNDKFTPILNRAGGLFLTSGSVSLIAGYYAVTHTHSRFVSFFGCDLVFDKADGQSSHFYGDGDEGPLKGNFKYNLRQEDRSVRLFIWALMHQVILTNSSCLPGTKLCFPHLPINAEGRDLFAQATGTKECADLLRHGGNALAFETENRTASFHLKQRIFEDDADAVSAMNRIMDHWSDLAPAVQAFNERLSEFSEADA